MSKENDFKNEPERFRAMLENDKIFLDFLKAVYKNDPEFKEFIKKNNKGAGANDFI